MAESGVYEIRNLANGRRYVGSAVDLGSRRSSHLRRLSRGIHSNAHLQRAYNRDGGNQFEFRVLFSRVAPTILARLEQAAMNILAPEYNIARRAGSSLGLHWKLSEETKQRMRLASMGNKKGVGHHSSLGYKMSAEAKRKIGDASRGNSHALGYRHTEEAKAKIGCASRTRSAETRAKLSEAAKRQWQRKKGRQ